MKQHFLYISLTFCFSIFLVACDDDEEAGKIDMVQSDKEIIAGNDMADYEFSMVSNFVDSEMSLSDENGRYLNFENSILPECATASYNEIARELTIDFGDENCQCSDGRMRRGQIVASFEGAFNAAGAKATITVEEYYVNDNLYSGIRTVERTSNPDEDLAFDVHVNGAISFTNNEIFTWTSDRTTVRIEGNETPFNFTDDVYETTGAASGINRNAVAYSANIITPLTRKLSVDCIRYLNSGTILFETENDFSMTLNYDPNNDKACDNKAVVVIGENSYDIEL